MFGNGWLLRLRLVSWWSKVLRLPYLYIYIYMIVRVGYLRVMMVTYFSVLVYDSNHQRFRNSRGSQYHPRPNPAEPNPPAVAWAALTQAASLRRMVAQGHLPPSCAALPPLECLDVAEVMATMARIQGLPMVNDGFWMINDGLFIGGNNQQIPAIRNIMLKVDCWLWMMAV